MAHTGIQTERNGEILEITFRMNEKNVVDASFGDGFGAILKEAASDKGLRGLIIKGSNGFFSNGFDPDSFVGADKAGIDAVIGPAFRLCAELLFHPLPSALVINGHAMGYGAILSLYADYRFMQRKQARFGFPEIQIGLPIPLAPAIMLQDLTDRIKTREMTFGAKALKGEQALDWGIADGVADTEEELLDEARKALKKLFRFPRSVIALNREAVYYRYKDTIPKAIEADVDLASKAILAPPGQEGLAALKEGRRTNYEGMD